MLEVASIQECIQYVLDSIASSPLDQVKCEELNTQLSCFSSIMLLSSAIVFPAFKENVVSLTIA